MYRVIGVENMKTWVIIAVIIIFIVAAIADLMKKGLGYKLLPAPLKRMVDKVFHKQ